MRGQEGVVTRFRSNPRRLFGVDAAGALLSALLLGVVLVRFEGVFGIPVPTLYLLAALPVLFALIDVAVYLGVRGDLSRPLRLIASLNLGYCALSLALASAHREVVTVWGWAYLLGEVAIVAALAVLELGVARGVARDAAGSADGAG